MLFHLLAVIFDQYTIKILSTKMSIAASGNHREHTLFNIQNWDVEGATTKVEDKYFFGVSEILMKTIRHSSRSRLIDKPLHFESGDLSCGHGCLSLMVAKRSRYRNNHFFYILHRKCLNICLDLSQNHCWYLFRIKQFTFALILNLNLRTILTILQNFEWEELNIFLNVVVIEFTTEESLLIIDGILRILICLIIRRLPNQPLLIIKPNHWRHNVPAVFFDNLYLIIPPNPSAWISRSKIYPDG